MTCELDMECEGKGGIKNNSQLCGQKYWVEDVGCDFPSIDQNSRSESRKSKQTDLSKFGCVRTLWQNISLSDGQLY